MGKSNESNNDINPFNRKKLTGRSRKKESSGSNNKNNAFHKKISSLSGTKDDSYFINNHEIFIRKLGRNKPSPNVNEEVVDAKPKHFKKGIQNKKDGKIHNEN